MFSHFPQTVSDNFREPSGHMTFIQSRINVEATSGRCVDVNATLYKRHVPVGKHQSIFSEKNKKSISKCHLLNFLHSILIAKKLIIRLIHF